MRTISPNEPQNFRLALAFGVLVGVLCRLGIIS